MSNEYDVDDYCSKISTVPIFAYTYYTTVFYPIALSLVLRYLNVHVQQVKSCIVSKVLTLRGFNKYNSLSN